MSDVVSETETRKPWEQLPDEPDSAYARFLAYLNLGASRSLDAAFRSRATKRNKTQRANGQWTKDSTDFNWVDRATAWDIEMLTQAGRNVVINFIAALEKLSAKTLEALTKETAKPKDWRGVMDAVNILGSFIPAETVAAIQSDAAEHRISAIGTGTRSDAGERSRVGPLPE